MPLPISRTVRPRTFRETAAQLADFLSSGALSAPERVEAGNALAAIGDPRFRSDAFNLPNDPTLGFVEIAEGPFTMGEGDESHRVTLPTYYIGRYHVTVAQFRAFVDDTGVDVGTPETLSGPANHPVVWVSWHEGRGSTVSGWPESSSNSPRAPKPLLGTRSEAERVRSRCRRRRSGKKRRAGENGGRYPWGDAIDPDKANYRDTGIGTTCPVGCFPAGRSPYGVADMSGNAWNWLRSLMGRDLKQLEFGYPYDADDGRENLDAGDDVLRGMRGGRVHRRARAGDVNVSRRRAAHRSG